MGSEPRGGATKLVEEALLSLALGAGDHAGDLLVVGGLTPAVLAATAPVPHHGTTDLDLLLEVGLVYDQDDVDLGWLEEALHGAGFRPRVGWVWEWSMAPVKVDLVCDRVGSPRTEIALPGCRHASAMNLPGPRAARCDAVPRTIGAGRDGRSVVVRFAGLGGYLLSKASAARVRGLPRDFYDFYFVALHNDAGGPVPAADAMRRDTCAGMLAELRDELRYTLRAAVTGERAGARAYAEEMRVVGDDTSYETLMQDAATASYDIARTLGIDLA